MTTNAAVWMECPWSVSMGARWAIMAINTIDVNPWPMDINQNARVRIACLTVKPISEESMAGESSAFASAALSLRA